jgi:serine/threonine-protein kinase
VPHLCPTCGSTIADDAPRGLCPVCVLRLACPSHPQRIGPYEIEEVIGRGAMAVVYRARQRTPSRLVALKKIHTGNADEPEIIARLEHPNIVRIYDAGVHDGEPFFTMQLIDGGTLADRDPRWRLSEPESAARLMIRVARAVQFGHERGVLHRDLKPANILLDQGGAPYVSDFGLAKVLTGEAWTHGSRIAGTPAYMAPEQAFPDGEPGAITPAADVYALGVILYELFTGRLPFTGKTTAELLRRLASEEPRSPRYWLPKLARDFETVCLTALEKNPQKRYPSAAAFADDLSRALVGGPIVAVPATRFDRALRWARWHPLATASMAGLLSLLLAFSALTLELRGAQTQARLAEQHERQTALTANAAVASGQAGAILFQLREYADRVEQAARDPEIAVLLEAPPFVPRAPTLLDADARGFTGVMLIHPDGYLRAQWPVPREPDVYAKSYAFRDYFRGARALGERAEPGVYLARAFRSEGDRQFKFALATPVFSGGLWRGSLVAMIDAKSAFGEVRMDDAADTRITALLGPRDNERDAPEGAPLPNGFSFLVHPGLPDGREFTLAALGPVLQARFGAAAPPGRQFTLRYAPPFTSSDFRDPVPNFGGSCLAAFAPVGATGFAVLVETRADGASGLTRTLAERAVARAAFGIGAVFLALVAGLVWLSRRQGRASRPENL